MQVAAGYQHSAFLTSSGEVYTCGSNKFGQLGYLTTSDKNPDVTKVEFGEELRYKKLHTNETNGGLYLSFFKNYSTNAPTRREGPSWL